MFKKHHLIVIYDFMATRAVRRFVDRITDAAHDVHTANRLMDHVTDPVYRQSVPSERLGDMAREASELRIRASRSLRSARAHVKDIASEAAQVLTQSADKQVSRSYSDATLAGALATVKKRI